MISQTAEYALRAIVFLSMNRNCSFTAQQVASVVKVPAPYLSKVMQSLVKSGLIESQRGMHGGFMMRRDSFGMTVLEVVNAVDPIHKITECPLGLAAHCNNLCSLHAKLNEATETIEKTFAQVTIGQLIQNTDTPPPLCDLELVR